MSAAADACAALAAPAKINLGLRILGRRPDGYHQLESLFLPLELADEVEVRARPGREASVTLALEPDPDLAGADGLGPADANLAARAARAFLAGFAVAVELEITLRKRVPVGAGLGGGSSDAAAVLRLLSRLVRPRPDGPAPSGGLAGLALSLGADVPYFLDPRPALVSGIGERIEPLEGFPGLWLVLLNPGVSLATAQVYAAYDGSGAALTRESPGSTMRALSGLRTGSAPLAVPDAQRARSWARVVTNDLEPPACGLCPDVARLREGLLGAGAVAAAMSGSGATVYGVFPDESSARSAMEEVVTAEGALRAAGAGGEQAGAGPLWARVVRTIGSDSGDPGLSGARDGGASPNW